MAACRLPDFNLASGARVEQSDAMTQAPSLEAPAPSDRHERCLSESFVAVPTSNLRDRRVSRSHSSRDVVR